MSQRFSLDRPTFEHLLAAASLVQQLQNQALRLTFNPSDPVALLGVLETQQAIQTGALDLEAACFQVTSLALKLTGAQGAGIWLFTKEALVYRAGAGSASNSERLRRAVLAGLAGSEPKADLRDLGDSGGCSKARSLLVAPIYQGPKVSGALAVFSDKEKALSDRDAGNVRLLAGILAHAVDKAAEAELMHSVALERAAMQKVVERLIPSLMRLTGQNSTATPTDGIAELEGGGADREVAPTAVSPSSDRSGIATDVSCPQPEDILLSVGSLRRPERTFADETELAEINPRWAQSVNPGFDRWVPIGPAERSSLHSPNVSAINSTAAEICSAPEERGPASPLLGPSASEISCDTVPVVVASPAPTVASEPCKPIPWWGRFFETVQSARESLEAVAQFRLNVRFAFNYRPTLRAMSLGLTAALLSVAAFLALQSGETAMLTSLAAGASSAKQSTTKINPYPRLSESAGKATDNGRATQNSRVIPHQPQAVPPAAETSHLRITDPYTVGVLNGLSRYEIASLQRRAEYGDDAAAFLLGMAYETGRGVRRSCTEAAKWVALAARQGNVAAEYNLAIRYRTADGVKANSEEAENWLRKAARHRHVQSNSVLQADRSDQLRAAGQP